jgi:GNAT superfamily N-acetyltransferase
MFRALLRSMRALGARRDRFSVRFPIGRHFEVAMWERPGRWLDDASLMQMVEDLRAVARASQEGKGVPYYGVLLGEREDLANRVVTIVYTRKHGHPVGFNALAYFDVPLGARSESVLHLGLTFVDPAYRRRRLPSLLYGVAAFLLLFKSGLRGFWISNVTQVPAIVGMVSDNYAGVYPHYNGRTRQTYKHLVLARAIMRDHRAAFGVGEEAGFDETRQIITNAYTGGSDELMKTFTEAPKHRRAEVNEFCRRVLDYDRGDDVLQLGRCTLRSTLRFLGDKLPQRSHVQLVYQALVLVAFATIVPVVRWLVPPDAADTKSESNRAGSLDHGVQRSRA